MDRSFNTLNWARSRSLVSMHIVAIAWKGERIKEKCTLSHVTKLNMDHSSKTSNYGTLCSERVSYIGKNAISEWAYLN